MTDGPVPIAAASDLAILQGAELTGVFVWKYGVTLSFDNKPLTITVEMSKFSSTVNRIPPP